jgi:hypothetical protein
MEKTCLRSASSSVMPGTMRYGHLANDTLLAAVEAGAKKMADHR